jgi:hypothetical protein
MRRLLIALFAYGIAAAAGFGGSAVSFPDPTEMASEVPADGGGPEGKVFAAVGG